MVREFCLALLFVNCIKDSRMDVNAQLKMLLDLAERTISSKQTDTGTVPRHLVNKELFAQLRSGGLAFILEKFGKDHPYYLEYDGKVKLPELRYAEFAKGILKAIQNN
jgi:hypothetical protein